MWKVPEPPSLVPCHQRSCECSWLDHGSLEWLASQPILQLRRGLVRRVVVEAPLFSIWVWRDSRSPEPERASTPIGSPRTVQMPSTTPPTFDSQFLVVKTSGPNWAQELGLEHPLDRRIS